MKNLTFSYARPPVYHTNLLPFLMKPLTLFDEWTPANQNNYLHWTKNMSKPVLAAILGFYVFETT